MLENGKSECAGAVVEKEIRKQLHDISNVLTVLVGRAEMLSKSRDLSEKDRKEIQDIVEQGLVCFEILGKTKKALNRAA